jgi:integrase
LVDLWFNLEKKIPMAGAVREARLVSPSARSRLKPGRQPHWSTIIVGRAHLGWQRWPDDRAGRWLLRRRHGGTYSVEPLGLADDDRSQPADGVSVLTHEQARAKAAELASSAEGRSHARLTVRRAMANYLDYLAAAGKNTRGVETTTVAHILPKLGDLEVASLTSAQIRRWLSQLAATPARKHSARGTQNFKPAPSDAEGVRRRRSSANRIFTVFRAALNHAYDDKLVSSNDAWGRRVKTFKGVDAARIRYLTVEEARRLINACAPAEFRQLVRAALETGCRYSELAGLEVSDFNPDSNTVAVRRSKTGKARHVVITAEGGEFFRQVCAGRRGSDLMFRRADGEQWGRAHQVRLMAAANERAKIDPPVVFHGLRHTWASLAVMNGVPLMVVAKNLGHSDTRMVERSYGHLSQSYIFDAIRAGAPRFGTDVEQVNIVPLKTQNLPMY